MIPNAKPTVVSLAVQSVGTYLKKAESYEKAVLKDRDPEDLHQMRVNLRRLRTVMQVFAPSLLLPSAGSDRAVAKVAGKLGKLRDLDVIADTLQDSYLPDLPKPEKTALTPVFKSLQKKRKKRFRQVKGTLKSDRYRAIKVSLRRWIAQPRCNATAAQAIDAVLPDLTLPMVSHLWLHPGWFIDTEYANGQFSPNARLEPDAIDAAVIGHSDVLHSLRKQVKRVRYQLRAVSRFYGDRLSVELTRLAELQEILGHLQDSLVMADFLHQAFADWETQLPTLESRLLLNRRRAWQAWQALQRYYLDPLHRDAIRQQLMQPEADVMALAT